MKPAKYQWNLPMTEEIPSDFFTVIQELQLPTIFASLLWERGIKTKEQIQNFIQPQIDDLHDPFLMYDMEKAVNRIHQAIENGEKIFVYGDYDVDGITSTTVMKETLELMGADVSYYLPNRFVEGYGPNQAVFHQAIEDGVNLIITVDNGVSGHEAIEWAKSQGVDTIITDHHELPEVLPDAYAIIHPRHPEGAYPFGDLAGVGVAFKLASALLDEIPMEFLDLVALGTVADLVSLTDENRILVKYGLESLKHSERIGIHALCQIADIKLSDISEETIGFALAPRLNAIGRLGSAMPGVELLTTFDDEEATQLAKMIQEKNVERQQIVKHMTAQALEKIQASPEQLIYILADTTWNEGVLGIVASRLVQETARPVILLSINEETGIAKGSGRSIKTVNLFELLQENQELLEKFGGHHAAAGMSLKKENIETLQATLNDSLQSKGMSLFGKEELLVDLKVNVADVTIPFIEQLQQLAPFGTDNLAPKFLLEHGQPEQLRLIGANKEHLKFELKEADAQIDCIAFGFGDEYDEIAQPDISFQVVGQLSINEWNGNRKPQLMVTDFTVPGIQLFDYRGNKIDKSIYHYPQTLFVFFDEKLKKQAKQIPVEHSYLFEDCLTINQDEYEQIMLVDCPTTIEQLSNLIQQVTINRWYISCFSKEECYLNGMPTREQFGQLFQFIHKHPKVDVRHKLSSIAHYLKIKDSLLIFMIQVFFDLGFVTIEDGVMTSVKDPIHRSLDESEVYQARIQKMKTEELILYSDLMTLKKWFENQEEMT